MRDKHVVIFLLLLLLRTTAVWGLQTRHVGAGVALVSLMSQTAKVMSQEEKGGYESIGGDGGGGGGDDGGGGGEAPAPAPPPPPKRLDQFNDAAKWAGKKAKTFRKYNQDKQGRFNDRHGRTMDRPDDLVTKDDLQNAAEKFGFGALQKAGSRELIMSQGQGDSGLGSYQLPSMRIKETVKLDRTPRMRESDSGGGKSANNMGQGTNGLGVMMFNMCYGDRYTETSPCFNREQHFLKHGYCFEIIDAANFIGVGFDGRGYYSAESRKATLLARRCAEGRYYMDQQVPDFMTCFPIYEIKEETQQYESTEAYLEELRTKAGLSNHHSNLQQEYDKYQKGETMKLAPLFGLSYNIGASTAKGGGKNSEKGTSTDELNQREQAKKQTKESMDLMAVMSVNILLFEISLDQTEPSDISIPFLEDFTNLPLSYLNPGANVQYQKFIIRYGTHFIRSAKMGGQLKIVKQSKAQKKMTKDQFAVVAEAEFKSMFSSIQSSFWKNSASASHWMGMKVESEEAGSSGKGSKGSSGKSKLEETTKNQQEQSESTFTNTQVEAVGGNPEIAQAVTSFYTSTFRDTFQYWLESIDNYAAPVDFLLRPIHNLLNINVRNLFHKNFRPQNQSYMCRSSNDTFKVVEVIDNTNVTKTIRCQYDSVDDFVEKYERRLTSLQSAIQMYLVDGPIPMDSYTIKGGAKDCESETIEAFKDDTPDSHVKLTELERKTFFVTFDVKNDISGVALKNEKIQLTLMHGSWYASPPHSSSFHLYEGCEDPAGLSRICVRNLVMTYHQDSGTFEVTNQDWFETKGRIPTITNVIANSTVARVSYPNLLETGVDEKKMVGKSLAIPCNVKWMNSQQIDVDNAATCIHFAAATKGDIFVLFSGNPNSRRSWYYIQIFNGGVAFYYALKLQKIVEGANIGTLGINYLYERYFICAVHGDENGVSLQYGKAKFDEDVGRVFAAYSYPIPKSWKFGRMNLIRFYTFGTGEDDVQFQDVRVTEKIPKELICGDQTKLDDGKYSESSYLEKDNKKGHCIQVCHSLCRGGCTEENSAEGCHACVDGTLALQNNRYSDNHWKCYTKSSGCPAGSEISTKNSTLCLKCKIGYFNAEWNSNCKQCKKNTTTFFEGAKKCVEAKMGRIASFSSYDPSDNTVLLSWSEPKQKEYRFYNVEIYKIPKGRETSNQLKSSELKHSVEIKDGSTSMRLENLESDTLYTVLLRSTSYDKVTRKETQSIYHKRLNFRTKKGQYTPCSSSGECDRLTMTCTPNVAGKEGSNGHEDRCTCKNSDQFYNIGLESCLYVDSNNILSYPSKQTEVNAIDGNYGSIFQTECTSDHVNKLKLIAFKLEKAAVFYSIVLWIGSNDRSSLRGMGFYGASESYDFKKLKAEIKKGKISERYLLEHCGTIAEAFTADETFAVINVTSTGCRTRKFKFLFLFSSSDSTCLNFAEIRLKTFQHKAISETSIKNCWTPGQGYRGTSAQLPGDQRCHAWADIDASKSGFSPMKFSSLKSSANFCRTPALSDKTAALASENTRSSKKSARRRFRREAGDDEKPYCFVKKSTDTGQHKYTKVFCNVDQCKQGDGAVIS